MSVIDGIANFDNIEVYEGSYLSQTYVYSTRNPFQKFILPNVGIDLDSLVVTVRPSVDSSVSTKYSRQDELFDNVTKSTITGNSNIYFIQEVEGEQYEVIFGDGVFGKALEDGNVVEMTYIVTNGSDGNGVNSFTFSGSVSYVRNSVEILLQMVFHYFISYHQVVVKVLRVLTQFVSLHLKFMPLRTEL